MPDAALLPASGGWSRPISKELAYAYVLLVACTMSGGVILGLGSFAGRALQAGILLDTDINIVFNVGFQMLTWLSLIWSILHDIIGPRACAIFGISIAAIGNLTIAVALLNHFTNPYVYALGYGMIGGGGNGAFITAFHFTALFESRRALRVAVLSCAFNVGGYAYLILNSNSIPLSTFFLSYFCYALVILVGVAFVYPDRA